MEFIIAHLVLNPQQDEQCTGHPDGEAGNVYCRKTLVPKQIPKGYFEKIFKHKSIIRLFRLINKIFRCSAPLVILCIACYKYFGALHLTKLKHP